MMIELAIFSEVPKHREINDVVQAGIPYFFAELPSGEKLFCRIRNTKTFPLQFGREVLASLPLLNKPDRVDWRDCKLTRDQEVMEANEFREAFEKFDFTL